MIFVESSIFILCLEKKKKKNYSLLRLDCFNIVFFLVNSYFQICCLNIRYKKIYLKFLLNYFSILNSIIL